MSVLLWQIKGESQIEVDGVEFLLSAGLAVWIPYRVRHSFTVGPNSSALPMFFPDDQIGFRVPTIVPIEDHVETACLALISSYYSLIAPPTDLTAIVWTLIAAQSSVPDGLRLPTSLPALRIARGILLDTGDRRTLAAWSRAVHLSTRSIERAFIAETGLTWRQWRDACRMERAAQLLAGSTASVATIAGRVGFSTHSSFTRAFREFHGTSPTTYREIAGQLAPVTIVSERDTPPAIRRVVGL
jgi:AraC-like DNA-binding protein